MLKQASIELLRGSIELARIASIDSTEKF